MSHNPKIVVVGSINVDLVVTVGKFPLPGETLLGSSFRQVGGGKGANQAVAAARLGSPVTLIARVGGDAFGKSAIAALKAERIDCRYVRETPGTPTGIAAITIQESTGENNIVVVPGANGQLSAADVEAAAKVFVEADALILSLEVPLDAIEAAVRIASDNDVKVILNPAPAQPLSAQLLERVDVLIPNETEAAILADLEDLEASAIKLSAQLAQYGMVVVTRGAAGLLSVTQGYVPFTLPAYRVDAVDTVGAGDCFTAALAFSLFDSHKRTLGDVLRFALAAAALAVTKHGAQDAMPRREDVLKLIEPGGYSGKLSTLSG